MIIAALGSGRWVAGRQLESLSNAMVAPEEELQPSDFDSLFRRSPTATLGRVHAYAA